MGDWERPTFMGLPARGVDAIGGAAVAVLGASEATPYDPAEASHSAGAPAAIRAASASFKGQLAQHDFDLGRALVEGKPTPETLGRVGVDLGDVRTRPGDAAGNRERIEAAVRGVLAMGAAPLVLGGDDSVPIPVLAGFAEHGPVTVVQVDAHVDWGDEIRGERLGYGSPMRRVAEMPWVAGMLQVGIRGLGSGESWQHDDARGWGSRIVTSREWRSRGAEAVLADLPEGGRYVVCVDMDGFDPVAFPAVAMPTPGGLGYEDGIDLLHGLARRGRIAGLVIAEYVPERDTGARSCALFAARLAAVGLGLMSRPS